MTDLSALDAKATDAPKQTSPYIYVDGRCFDCGCAIEGQHHSAQCFDKHHGTLREVQPVGANGSDLGERSKRMSDAESDLEAIRRQAEKMQRLMPDIKVKYPTSDDEMHRASIRSTLLPVVELILKMLNDTESALQAERAELNRRVEPEKVKALVEAAEGAYHTFLSKKPLCHTMTAEDLRDAIDALKAFGVDRDE